MSAEPEWWMRSWDAWRDVHQPFELNWWKTHIPKGHLDDPGFTAQWQEVKDFIQPHGAVIDIGCGPRPAFAPCTVIEPLASEYQSLVPEAWWRGIKVHIRPAEHYIRGLAADTVICWNCLDHTIGWKDILHNMWLYAGLRGTVAVATDFFPPFAGHPGFERASFMAEIYKYFSIVNQREPFGRQLALVMKCKPELAIGLG